MALVETRESFKIGGVPDLNAGKAVGGVAERATVAAHGETTGLDDLHVASQFVGMGNALDGDIKSSFPWGCVVLLRSGEDLSGCLCHLLF